MTSIRIPRPWETVAGAVTDERAWLDRRQLLRAMGIVGASVLAAGCAPRIGSPGQTSQDGGAHDQQPGDAPAAGAVELPRGVDPAAEVPAGVFPAARNPAFADAGRPLTPEDVAGRYNNFYEFSQDKAAVSRLVDGFHTRPWTLEVSGLVNKPGTFDIDTLLKTMPMEERVYRFRCVEAWAMTVPWTGFPLKALIDRVEPRSTATHVALHTKLDRDGFPEQRPGRAWVNALPWPYYEGLTLAEAANELTLLATGIYGHQLPRQHGAPLRLIVPWKYGFKSIKSIVRIDFIDHEPKTFWNDLAPSEYKFTANVEPAVPHPRWSQATERLIDTGERVPTRLYNGYGESVAHLY